MGREVKRVALDFDWPIDKPWKGYCNPHYQKCRDCDGRGSTASRYALDHLVHLIMIAGENSLHGSVPHPWVQAAGVRDVGDIMYELTTGLAGRALGRMDHDGCDRWSAMVKIIEAAGLPEKWGWCEICGGEGVDPEAQEKYEAWEKYSPPEGPGWQLWETVTEGSPISPVFETAEELIDHMAAPAPAGQRAGVFQGYDRQVAERFVKGTGHAPTFMQRGNEPLVPGIEFLAQDSPEK